MKKEELFIERRILNTKSHFEEKKLCDGITFTAGDSCKYSCDFCYVPSMGITRNDIPQGKTHQDVIIRRKNPAERIRSELTNNKGEAKFLSENDTRVCYASPLVDVAADIEMCKETIEICKVILSLTNWQIRLLSKSNLLPKIAEALDAHKTRMIYGVSTGTLDNNLAKAFERGTPLVSKRIESLHWLQNHGYRTYGMICPSLPLPSKENYASFSAEICKAIRIEKCEHVWAEVINVRGESLKATAKSLADADFEDHKNRLQEVSESKEKWEAYNRATFLGHTENIPPDKLRYLTYVTKSGLDWWKKQKEKGAVLLGKHL
jgi:DNA repair photolyase